METGRARPKQRVQTTTWTGRWRRGHRRRKLILWTTVVNGVLMTGTHSLLQASHDDGRDEEDGGRQEGSGNGSLSNSSLGSHNGGPHLLTSLVHHNNSLPQLTVPHQHSIQSASSCWTHRQ